MYEERRKFSIGDLLIQLLLVIIFVVVMIWLFPSKSYLADAYATKDYVDTAIDSKLEFVYGRIFADNVDSMKEAATGYFTTSRLPKKIGDSETITLEEMLEKKLVLPFKDSNNETCDLENSFVKITKMDDEYQMKVQLDCSDYSDYVIVYMGCYDYCDSDICQAKTTTTVAKTTTTKTETKKPTQTVAHKDYEYQYRMTTQNEYSAWGAWSGWSTKAVESSNLVQVEMNKVEVLTGYEQIYGITGYKTENYTDYENQTTYSNVTNKVQTGTTTVKTGTGTYSDWAYQGYVTSYYALSTYVSDTSTTKYVYISDKTTVDCSNVCKNVTTYTYKKYTRSYTEGTKTVPVYEDKTRQVPTTTQVPVTKTRQVPVYGYVNGDPIYKTVTYYRYRTRTQLSTAETIYTWSKSESDTTLISQGYVLTGESREV